MPGGTTRIPWPSPGPALRDEFTQSLDDFLRRRILQKHFADTHFFQGGDILFGHHPASDDNHVFGSLLPKSLEDLGEYRHLHTGQQAYAENVGVLLNRRRDDFIRRPVKAGVNHIHSGIAQRPRDDFYAAVMPIKPYLRQQYADRRGHGVSPNFRILILLYTVFRDDRKFCGSIAEAGELVIASSNHEGWPDLAYGAWKDTRDTLHLWTQVVGKIRLALTPWLNHSWHVPLYITARGMTTSPIPYSGATFEIEFDFADHVLRVRTSDARSDSLRLTPMSVADFYGALMRMVDRLGIRVRIATMPCELVEAIPFDRDHAHAAYDPVYANRFWH